MKNALWRHLPLTAFLMTSTAIAADPALVGIQARYESLNLFSYRNNMSPTTILSQNEALKRALIESVPPQVRQSSSTVRLSGSMDKTTAEKLYYWLDNHPVASQRVLRRYDPDENIGFCFGRAFAAHMGLISSDYKIYNGSIRKIWAIGPMRGGWGHHVATIVSATDGGWWVIDPVFGQPLKADQWISNVVTQYQQTASNPVAFFVTKPERFGPASPAKYSNIDLYADPTPGAARTADRTRDLYKGYFMDAVAEMIREAKMRSQIAAAESR